MSRDTTLILYFLALGVLVTLGGLFVHKHSK